MHVQRSWTCLWPCPQVAYVLAAKMRHGCSDNSRQAVRNCLQLLGPLGLGQALSARGRVGASFLPYWTTQHIEIMKMGALWSNCLLLYNTSISFCFGEQPLRGKKSKELWDTHSSPCVLIGWGPGAKGHRFIQHGNNSRAEAYIFFTSPQPGAQPSLPSMGSWETSFNPSSLNCQRKAPAVGNREDRCENIPSTSLLFLTLAETSNWGLKS